MNDQRHEERLTDLRRQVDETDDAIVALLSKRFELSAQIAEVKTAVALPIHCPDRERSILDRLPSEKHRRIFAVILEVSRAIQAERRDVSP
ncbi:MAG: chorismate mutase [Chloroherpetonaceae bacterium]|nr:chorismate mutase [Chloroherpetonaceae bacterium]MDW8438303.1 chorismate mutase [Chloroherpetonaceae bacterium]